MLSAQDAVKVDPKHYTVISDNAQVRILKVHYGPHEKSVMHSHPATVAVFLTDATGKFTYPGGRTKDFTVKAGDAPIHRERNPFAREHRRQGDGCDRGRTERRYY
jgi:quercetin dioxygenase-like cupin family protein